jgi:hypothetical protein
MILARRSAILATPLLLALAGCLTLPPPPPATERSQVGDLAPVATLARTGAPPGVLSLRELWGENALVLVFYRGAW